MDLISHHVSCDGLVASGKSTVIRELQLVHNCDSIHILQEPLSAYTHMKTIEGEEINPLSMFYENKSSALPFQLYVLDIFEQLFIDLENTKRTEPYILLSDRAIFGNEVFTKCLTEAGHISDFGLIYYETKLAKVKQIKHIFPDSIFFLNCPPETCYQNLHNRGRKMETSAPNMLKYLCDLEKSYNTVIQKYSNHECDIRRTDTYNIADRVGELYSFIQEKRNRYM